MRNRLEEIWKKHAGLLSGIVVFSCVILILFVWKKLGSTGEYNPGHFMYAGGRDETAGFIDTGEAGIFSYGPYANVKKGNYKITIEYEADTDMEFDVVTKGTRALFQTTVAKGTLPKDQNRVSAGFYVERDVKNHSLEIRTMYPGDGCFQLVNITIERQFLYWWCLLIEAVVMVITFVLFCRDRLLTIIADPKAFLYYSGFYTLLMCLGLYWAAFLSETWNIILCIVTCIVIVFHSREGKKGSYDLYFTFQNFLNVIRYFYVVLSLYMLDLYMRRITMGEEGILYDTSVPDLFSFSIIACIVLIIALLPRTWMKRLVYGVVYYTFALLLLVQKIYYQVFGRLFSFKDMALAKEGSDYMDYVIGFMNVRFICLVLMLFLVGMIGIFLIRSSLRIRWKGGLAAVPVLVSIVFYTHTIYKGDFGGWSSFADENYIYANMTDRKAVFELCGFYQYVLKDLQRTLFANSGDKRERMEEVSAFFESRREVGESGNSMTGIFEGKNVIFVLMESIDDIACNEEVMPNLYRMSKEGIYFSNMYASIYGTAATANSEMVTNVGLYAPLDGSLVYSFSDNYFPCSLAARLTDVGYTARQYHYNVPGFYSRDLMNAAFGYQEYVSFANYENATMDTVLIENDELYGKFVQEVPFFNYIITYTAHLSYNLSNGDVARAMRKHPQYEAMTGSEEMNCYFAKARITDDMLGGLMERLENDGLLKNTVIIAIGDHYPYGIEDKEVLYAFSGVEPYEQLLYKVPCVIWTPEMTPVTIDKLASSADLVPTIVNLMGVGDGSMYVGRDIFDEDYEGYAYFADGSWIRGDTFYSQGNVVYGTAGEDEIAWMNQRVMDLITVNDNILKTDYYLNK